MSDGYTIVKKELEDEVVEMSKNVNCDLNGYVPINVKMEYIAVVNKYYIDGMMLNWKITEPFHFLQKYLTPKMYKAFKNGEIELPSIAVDNFDGRIKKITTKTIKIILAELILQYKHEDRNYLKEVFVSKGQEHLSTTEELFNTFIHFFDKAKEDIILVGVY